MRQICSSRLIAYICLTFLCIVFYGENAAGQAKVPQMPQIPTGMQVDGKGGGKGGFQYPGPGTGSLLYFENPCDIPKWLEAQDAQLDEVILSLLKRYGIDKKDYLDNAPMDCAQKLFAYRVTTLKKIAAVGAK